MEKVKDIRDSRLYHNFVAKFDVDLSNGKKGVRFPKAWQKLKTDFTSEDSKNVAILTGSVNKIMVVDIDKPKDGEIDGLQYFEDNVCKIEELDTIITKTINGGYHIYFKYNDNFSKNIVRLKDIQEVSIDVKTNGGCAYEGECYELIKDATELMAVPIEFMKLFRKESTRLNLENQYCGDYSEDIIQLVLDNLSSIYYNNYQNWFNVLCVLKNLNFDVDKAKEFSQKSNKFDNQNFIDTWNTIEIRDTPGFGTLMYFLKQSVSKVKYDNLIAKLKKVEKNVETKRLFLEVCKIFYNLYKEEIVVCNIKDIYVLNEYGIWKKEDRESKYFLDKIREFIKFLKTENILFDLDKPASYNVFINEVLKEFQVENIEWNCNPYIFAFNNGVFDLNTYEFRKGKYNEFITMTCGYNYVYEDSTKARLFYEDFLIKKEVRDYYLNIVASHLVDIHKREEFIVKIGKGSNGKSKENQLLEYVFGNYAYTCKSSMLTCNANDNPEGPTPVMLGMKNKRMILYQEIKEGKVLDSETIKRLTGGDKINARDLYQSGTDEFYIKGCQMMGCNDLPGIDRFGYAILRRLIFIECITQFVTVPVKENEREMKEFNTKDLRHSMFQLLVEHSKNEIPREFNKRPQFVKDALGNYLGKKDDIKRFIRNFITKDDNGYIKRTELRSIFNIPLHKTEYNLRKMNYDRFEELIITELDTYIKPKHDNGQRNCIIGYRLISEYED